MGKENECKEVMKRLNSFSDMIKALCCFGVAVIGSFVVTNATESFYAILGQVVVIMTIPLGFIAGVTFLLES